MFVEVSGEYFGVFVMGFEGFGNLWVGGGTIASVISPVSSDLNGPYMHVRDFLPLLRTGLSAQLCDALPNY